MPALSPDICLALWHQALVSPYGVAIACDNPALVRQYLYQSRKAEGNPDLAGLVVVTQPKAVWICKRGAI